MRELGEKVESADTFPNKYVLDASQDMIHQNKTYTLYQESCTKDMQSSKNPR